jgi:hypothetical protein
MDTPAYSASCILFSSLSFRIASQGIARLAGNSFCWKFLRDPETDIASPTRQLRDTIILTLCFEKEMEPIRDFLEQLVFSFWFLCTRTTRLNSSVEQEPKNWKLFLRRSKIFWNEPFNHAKQARERFVISEEAQRVIQANQVTPEHESLSKDEFAITPGITQLVQ